MTRVRPVNTEQMNAELRSYAERVDLQFHCGADGAFNSDIAIVSEAPGEREVSLGMPLVGGSGQLLWTTLRKYGITRNKVYITNVIKRRMSYDSGKLILPRNELDHWQSLLRWELCQLPNLRYVLLLGGPALEAVAGERPVTMWRGSVIDRDIGFIETYEDGAPPTKHHADLRCVVTYNPAMVIREPKTEVTFRMDIAKLPKVRDGKFVPHNIEPIINPSPDEGIEWCDRMHDEKLPIAYDIETMGGETACVGLTNSPYTGMCINFRDARTNRWSTQDEMRVRLRLQQLFGDAALQFVAHNGNFDSYWLWYKDRIRVHKVWFDTMLAHHTLYSQLPHSLAFLTSQYTTHPYYKDEGKDWREGGNIDQFWEYNVKDICITRAAQMRMQNELQRLGQEDFFYNHVMRLQPHLVRMTVGGLRIDLDFKEKLAAQLREEVADMRHRFQELAREASGNPTLEINPDSPPQLRKLFFHQLRLVGRGASTDEANRKRMLEHPKTPPKAREMIQSLDRYKKDAKFLGTYAEMKVDPDGRVRCEYKQTGVQSAPGRLSSSQVMWGSGMNLQNQPDRAHEMFITDPGYCFLYFDLSQAEARVVGWLANIETWIEQFEQARVDGRFDCHRALASDMFRIPYDEVPTADRELDGTPTLRFIAKRCRHGLNYRMAADRLAQTTGLALDRAREAYNLYHRLTPELRQWWAAVEQEVRKTGLLVSPKGRVLRIMERLTDEALESIVAFKPQSTVGDHVSQCMYECEDDDDWPHDARMALNIHDALIAMVPIPKVERCAKVMKRHAEAPITVNGRPLIIPAEFKVSTPDEQGVHRWSTLKKGPVEGLHDIAMAA